MFCLLFLNLVEKSKLLHTVSHEELPSSKVKRTTEAPYDCKSLSKLIAARLYKRDDQYKSAVMWFVQRRDGHRRWNWAAPTSCCRKFYSKWNRWLRDRGQGDAFMRWPFSLWDNLQNQTSLVGRWEVFQTGSGWIEALQSTEWVYQKPSHVLLAKIQNG